LLVFALLAALVACGGGTSGTTTSTGGTPTGTYNVTVTGASGTLQHSVIVDVTVQ
jgi:ABC-type glycerol-3-phosphate transport system substrate-binding protein